MNWFLDFLGRPQNLVLIGMVVACAGLLLSLAGLFQLNRRNSAQDISGKPAEMARLSAELARNRAQMSALQQEHDKWFTGGDSFCYLSTAIIATRTAVRSLVHEGKYPLYDVKLTITDLADKGATPERIEIDYLAPHSSRLVGRWHLPSQQHERAYAVHISARNGAFDEELKFTRDQGSWRAAIRVVKDATGEVLLARPTSTQPQAPPRVERSRTIEAVPEGRWKSPEKSLPPFELKDLENRNWTLSSLAGKTVLINIWATWCGSCIYEHPGVQRLFERTRGSQEYVVLTFNIDEDTGHAVEYMRKNGYTFPVLPARELIGRLFEVVSIPRNWIIDQKGVLRWEQVGFSARPGDWEAETEQMLRNSRRDGS